ncbi:MAG: hypothetical protein M0T75_01955 [Chloroflexi bacterium]|nr:hypothetical protein [Chloroflexota bacterium]
MTDRPAGAPPPDPLTVAALDEVAAARAALGDELVRLEATARAAVDVRARVRRHPGRAAAAAVGTAFVVLGGPRRVLRSAKRRVFGAPDPLPPSLLPDEVEKAVRALGDDGAKVRGALEREFAAFVDTHRKSEPRLLRRILLSAGVPVASRLGREVAKRVFTASGEDVARREADLRARAEGAGREASSR